MGEARRRQIALGEGKPCRMPLVCPKCKSIRIQKMEWEQLVNSNGQKTINAVCIDCSAVWEAYPDDWHQDVVGAPPCDNCAFRPGSAEQKDKANWEWLINLLKSGGDFRCHKGAPIIKNAEGGIEFDRKWIEKNGRTCAGFMRMIWGLQKKDPSYDWIRNRYENVLKEGFDIPPRLSRDQT